MNTIKLKRDQLSRTLNSLRRVVPSNALIPAWENILFDFSNEVLTLTATDGLNAIIATINVNQSGEFKALIPGKKFIDIISKIKSEEITLTSDYENHELEIISKRGKYKLSGENPSDYPLIDPVNSQSVSINGRELSDGLVITKDFVSTDDLKPSHCGVFVKLENNKLHFVSTDATALSEVIFDNEGGINDFDFILHKKSVDLLSSVITDSVNVELNMNDTHSSFKYKNLTIISKLVDEQFPNYKLIVMDTDNMNYHVSVNKNLLINAVDRVSTLGSDHFDLVDFKFGVNTIVLQAKDVDFNREGIERIESTYEGEEINISLSSKRLIKILKSLDTESVIIHIHAKNKPVIITESSQQDGEQIKLLLMPYD